MWHTGFGSVYLAFDHQLNRQVALKLTQPAPGQSITELKREFLMEGKLLTALKHSAICGVYDYFEGPNNSLYLVMQYIQGTSLEEWVASRPPVTEAELRDLMESSLEVLAYLHSLDRPIVHRDVKPANFVRADTGELVLVDFGISRARLKGELDTVAIGTPGYAAPEQARGASEPASDIYAWAGTMFYCATGQPPEQNRLPAFPPLRGLRPDLSEGLELLLTECAALAPEQRPPARDALRRLRGDASPDSSLHAVVESGCPFCGSEDPPRFWDLCPGCRLSHSLAGLGGDAWADRGATLAQQHRMLDALEHLERALELGYSTGQVQLARARCLVRTGRRQEALQVFESLPLDNEVALELARLQASLRDVQGALSTLQQSSSLEARALYAILKGKPDTVRSLANQHPEIPALNALYSLQMSPDEALNYLLACLKQNGEHPDLLRLALRKAHEVKRAEDSRLLLRALSRSHPGDPLVLLMKARLLAGEGNAEESNRLWLEYRQACRDPEAELEYAAFLTRIAGKPELAVDVLEALLADPRLGAKALLDLATVYLLLNRLPEAEKLLRPVARKADCPAHALSRYALALSQLGRLEKAREFAGRALQLDPSDMLAREVSGIGRPKPQAPTPKPTPKKPALPNQEREMLEFFSQAELVTEATLRARFGPRAVGILQQLIYKLGEQGQSPIREAGFHEHQLLWRYEA